MSEQALELRAPSIVRRAVRTRWRDVVIIAGVITLLGLVYAGLGARSYTATAQVLVDPLQGNAYSSDSLASAQQVTVGLTTEANLVGSPQVGALTDSSADGGQVTGSVVLNSQLIEVTCTSGSREQARACAQGYAEAFLKFRESAASAVRAGDIESVKRQIIATQSSLRELDAELAQHSAPAGTSSKAQLATLRLSDLQQSLADAKSESTHPGSVVVPAALPSALQMGRTLVLAVLALLLGLAAGLVVALWRTFLDDRLDSRYVTSVAGTPVWGAVHSIVSRRGIDQDAVERASEEYRQLRAAVLANAPARRVITMCAAEPDHDISEFCVNLADFMTGSGFQVMLVDASRSGALSRRLGFAGHTGVSDVLQHEVTPENAIEVAGDVWVMPAGTDPAAAEDLTAGPGFTDMVRYLGVGADYVLVVAPPADTSVGLACAAAADTVLLVAADGRTTQELVERQFGHLAAHRLRVDGLVLAGPSSATDVEAPAVADADQDVDGRADGHEDGHEDAATDQVEGDESLERPLLRLAGGSDDVGKSA